MALPETTLRHPVLILALAATACAGGEDRGSPSTLLRSEGERRGAAVYAGENCARCHTLFEAPPPSGPFPLPTSPEEGWTSRVGPDLGAEGHRRSDDWHYAHLYAPSSVVRGSPMPALRHLFRPGPDGRPHPTPEAADLVAYLQALGRARRDVWAEFRRREPQIPPPPSPNRELLARGDRLYRQHCAVCHGESGDGGGEAAPLLDFRPRDLRAVQDRFMLRGPGEPPADADLFRTITLGAGTGAAMPAFYWLSGLDRWALVARIKEFAPRLRGTPLGAALRASSEPGGATGRASTLERGRRLWEELGCPSCHGASGAGGTREEAGAAWTDTDSWKVPRSGNLTHACALRGGASGFAIERAIFGRGMVMPSYGEAVPEGEDRRALRDYVLSLQDAPESP